MREGKQKAGTVGVDLAPRTRLLNARPFLLLEALGWMPGAGASAEDAPQRWCLDELRSRLLRMQQRQTAGGATAAASRADAMRKITAAAACHIVPVGATAALELVEMLLVAAKDSARANAISTTPPPAVGEQRLKPGEPRLSPLHALFTAAVVECYGPACSALSSSAKTALWALEPALLQDVVYRSVLSGAARPFAGLVEISSKLFATGAVEACTIEPSLAVDVLATLDKCVLQSRADSRVLRVAHEWMSLILDHAPLLRSAVVSAIARSFAVKDGKDDGGRAVDVSMNQEADNGGGGGGGREVNEKAAAALVIRVLLEDEPPQLASLVSGSTALTQPEDLIEPAKVKIESLVNAVASLENGPSYPSPPRPSSSACIASVLKRLALHQFRWTEAAAYATILGTDREGGTGNDGNPKEVGIKDGHDDDDRDPDGGNRGAAAAGTRGGCSGAVIEGPSPRVANTVPPTPPASFRLLCWIYDADVRVSGTFQKLAYALHRAVTADDLIRVVAGGVAVASAPHCSPLGVGSILLLSVTLWYHPAAIGARGEALMLLVRSVLQVAGTAPMILDMLERDLVQGGNSSSGSGIGSGSIVGSKGVLLEEIVRQLVNHFQSSYGTDAGDDASSKGLNVGAGAAEAASLPETPNRNTIALADGIGRCRRLQKEVESDSDVLGASESGETELLLGFAFIP